MDHSAHSSVSTSSLKPELRPPERTEEDELKLFQVFRGYSYAERGRATRQWVFDWGFDIQHNETGVRRWVCLLCLKRRDPKPANYTAGGLQNAEKHLFERHGGIADPTGKRGIPSTAAQKKLPTIASIMNLNTFISTEQELANRLIKRFDKTRFQQLVVNWIIGANLPFDTAENHDLRALFQYLNPSVEITNANITGRTVYNLAEQEFDKQFGKVADAVQKAPGLIHLAYDGWQSRNRHALYGVTAVYRDQQGRPQKIVLGLPALRDRHSGANIANEILHIVAKYGIERKVGYFTLDNASSNDSAMSVIGESLGFAWQQRRVRCIGHVLNLVVKAILFGQDAGAFEKEVHDGLLTAQREHERWRSKGPVGKLHNFCKVRYVSSSDFLSSNAYQTLRS
jgi:hypothetical protein